MLQRQLYFFGTYMVERDLLTTWVELARNSSVIVDVGANVGVYSLAALSARPDADVHAFEPTPEIARHLRETAELNELRNLAVHEAAVTSRSGDVALIRYAGETGTNGGMNYIEESSSDAGQTVTATTIDEFCRMNNIDTIDLMKIDVQGCEHDVLRGAEVAIRRGAIRTIFMELNWSDGASGPAAESIRMLANEGYRFADPRRAILWRNAGSWLNALDDVVAQRLVA
jgi:FkbM family methyltransferase